MALLEHQAPDLAVDTVEAEALIKEARRLRRRRWSIGCAVAVLAMSGSAVGYSLASTGGHSMAPSGPADTQTSTPRRENALPRGPAVTLDVAESLAVGPNGALYVAAPDQHQIVIRAADGTFRVVAGTGISGYSGNGQKALDAELSDPTDLTFDSKGDLYFVDSGRVRVVRTDGVIETVAGNGSTPWPAGSHPVPTVANGAPALTASFGSDPSIAFGPGGVLYIATTTQLLRMTHEGRLDAIPTRRASFGKVRGCSGTRTTACMPASLDEGLATVAVAKDGSIYVSGFNGWAIWHVALNGEATYVGYDRRSGGGYPDLVTGPGGTIYADDGGAIVRVTSRRLVPISELTTGEGRYFELTNFAFGPDNTLYADEIPGNLGFEDLQELVSLRAGQATVLWTEPTSAAARRSP